MSAAADTQSRRAPQTGGRRNPVASYGVWIALAVALVVLPYVFSSRLSLSTMSMMGIMVIFALSYNMLLGQTGLLSFGHAVFFGLGGFVTAHMMNAAGPDVPLPLVVFPVVGGVTGLVFGIILGSVATKRAATAFAMITLGIGELVASSALILRHFFGGEMGVSTNRTDLFQLFGFNFGPQIQVYYLIAAWCFVSIVAMYALTRTPFGRVCNAVRDNPGRIPFIGYDTQMVRFISFSLAGLFAGVAGGLAAVNFEIVTSSQLGITQSGAVILMTYIGGVGNFAGPIIGAIVVTYLQLTLSDITDIWQLYFGLGFIGMVMFAPNGIAGLLALQGPLLRSRQFHRVAPYYLLALVPGLIALSGFSMLMEMANQLTRIIAQGSSMSFLYIPFEVDTPLPWLIAVVLLVAGTWLFLRALRIAGDAYGDAVARWRAP